MTMEQTKNSQTLPSSVKTPMVNSCCAITHQRRIAAIYGRASVQTSPLYGRSGLQTSTADSITRRLAAIDAVIAKVKGAA